MWNTKVQKAEVTYYNAKGEKLSGENSQINEFFVKELKDNLKANTDKSVTVGKAATNMIFAVNNTSAATNNFFEVGKQYTAVITFYDAKENGEKLNSIKFRSHSLCLLSLSCSQLIRDSFRIMWLTATCTWMTLKLLRELVLLHSS